MFGSQLKAAGTTAGSGGAPAPTRLADRRREENAAVVGERCPSGWTCAFGGMRSGVLMSWKGLAMLNLITLLGRPGLSLSL